MRIGQLDAAGMTGVGLCRIHPCLLSMQLPMLVRTDQEMAHVLEKMKPEFEQQLEHKGFRMVLWNHIGWVHFFSKKPVVYPADLQAQKMFMYAGDPHGAQVWKEMGFHPVPLSPTDVMSSLQSGMVEAFTTSPLAAASYQWFALAPNMCGLRWAPFLGGVVISSRTWKRIPDTYHDALMKAAARIGAAMQQEIRKADTQAIAVMKKHGLTVHAIDDEAVRQWKTIVDKGFDKFIGTTFDESCYQNVKKRLEEFRNSAVDN
jgi:TRAP-type C4-dicarboxylate transport system substrate-binding protein